MRKILLSIATVAFIGSLAVGATGALFSDTETSTGNTFTAGSIDLKIDNHAWYNGELQPDFTWELSDLEDHLFFNYGDLRVTQKPVPVPGVGEVLVKVDSIAICGSDPAIIAKGWQNHPPLGEFIPGHEFTGTVVAIAPDVTELKTGDRVAVEPHKGCGRCVNCLRGLYTTCLNYGKPEKGHRHYGFCSNGGYAEYAVCHVNTLHRLPESISLEEGALLTTAGTVMYGYERIGWMRPGETVVVTGPGAI